MLSLVPRSQANLRLGLPLAPGAAPGWIRHEEEDFALLQADADDVLPLLDEQLPARRELEQLRQNLHHLILRLFRKHLLVAVQDVDLDAKQPDWLREGQIGPPFGLGLGHGHLHAPPVWRVQQKEVPLGQQLLRPVGRQERGGGTQLPDDPQIMEDAKARLGELPEVRLRLFDQPYVP